MLDGQDLQQAGGTVAGGAVGLGFITWVLRKAWRQYSAEIPETRKDQAEAVLFDNLRAEISRMGDTIATLRREHEHERVALETRVQLLEVRIRLIIDRVGYAKRKALDVYALVSRELVCENPACEAAKTRVMEALQEIIENEDDRRASLP